MDMESQKEEFRAIQNQIRSRVNHTSFNGPFRYIGGADLTEQDGLYVGCLVVVDREDDLKPIYSKCTKMQVDVPYIPGYLCFREGPIVERLYHDFCTEHPDIHIDVLLVDGSGEWHFRGVGLGVYVGVNLEIPTIGVFKSYLRISDEYDSHSVHQMAQERNAEVGEYFTINAQIENGEQVSLAIMKTTTSNPYKEIFISSGNMMDLTTSANLVKQLCTFREPEPLRLADRISRRYVANELKKNKS